jgi:hypothetical protein
VALLLSGVGSIDASAALSGGQFLTVPECLDLFGSSFVVTYWDGSQYVETTATYQSTSSLGTIPVVAQSDYIESGRLVLDYTFTGLISADPSQVQLDIAPVYSLFQVDQVHTVILFPSGPEYTNVYQSPQWIWSISGVRTVFEGLSSSNEMYRIPVGNTLCQYVPVDWDSQSLTTASSQRAVFSGGNFLRDGSTYHIFIGVPYVTSGASGSSGSGSSSTSSSGSINVDLHETNGLLDGILDVLDGLLDGIAALFIPDQEFLEDFSSDLEDAAVEHLGGVWEAEQLVADHLAVFTDTAASGSITIPSAAIPLAGETFYFPPAGSNTVDLKPDELENSAFSLLYDGLAMILDFLCTAAFVNMCKKKVEHFLNPDTEVVE